MSNASVLMASDFFGERTQPVAERARVSTSSSLVEPLSSDALIDCTTESIIPAPYSAQIFIHCGGILTESRFPLGLRRPGRHARYAV